MEMIATSTRDDIAQAWGVLHNALGLSDRIRDEAQYRHMVEFAESIAESLPDNDNEPLWGLVEIITDQINDYEARHYPTPEVSGADMLRFLMEQHGLKQSDLAEIGGQSVVSEILSGKRSLNVRQIRTLAKRFGVSPAAFV
ncbi:MAG: helix-turn-helix domain-containing protein [Betaproteobacteria bacterium]|nr:helix-turn-helix domain-containing protein [Betaproteobacteria bacterium]